MKKVLVVDDSSVMLATLRQSLEMAGFQVETATDGLQALNRIKAGLKPDLVLTDLNMPVMNGLDLIKNARPILRFTPILVLTTESQASKRDEAKRSGATGWLVKPVGGSELIRVIQQVLPGT